MILEGLHEKEIFTESYPFRLETNASGDFHYPLHWHQAVELVYTVDDICRIEVVGTEYLLEERDMLIIPPGEIHSIHSRGPHGKRYFIQFDTCLLDGFGGMNLIETAISQVKKVSYLEAQDLHQAMENQVLKIIEEYEKKDYAYALSLNARIFDLLVILSRDMADRLDPSYNNHSTKKMTGLQRINIAFKYIEENYQNDITLKDVSSAAGFSEYHFSRIFKEALGKNFTVYLNEFRVKKAEKLLMNNDCSIAQIAHDAGFNSFATFNRIFKNIKGCTPSLYKKVRI